MSNEFEVTQLMWQIQFFLQLSTWFFVLMILIWCKR